MAKKLGKQALIREIASEHGFDPESSPKDIIEACQKKHPKITITAADVQNWKMAVKKKSGVAGTGKRGRKPGSAAQKAATSRHTGSNGLADSISKFMALKNEIGAEGIKALLELTEG